MKKLKVAKPFLARYQSYNHPYARLSIMKKEIINPREIEFKVFTQHQPINDTSKVKIRATLIQEHKEIGSDVKFIRIKK
jgi:hypothetical protein